MNVLLAEANIEYDKLKEMDEINPSFQQTDVAIVIGANDVVNPLARTDPSSPIAGMPILDVDKARTVVVIKRSLSPGFAGIPNPLFAAENTLMYFSDGKKAIMDLTSAIKSAWALNNKVRLVNTLRLTKSSSACTFLGTVLINLNGESYEIDQAVSVTDLLVQLKIDPRRVAVEHNLKILKRHTFEDTVVHDGDHVEIVNFVGGD